MALTMPFRQKERFPALQQARQVAEEQARQVASLVEGPAKQVASLVEGQARQVASLVEQQLPRRRQKSFWARPFGITLIAFTVVGAALAAVAAYLLRERDSDDLTEQPQHERGLATTHTEDYDANRASGEGNVDVVRQAVSESFPASDPPAWGSGPDVPVIREGEHKEELPYQQS